MRDERISKIHSDSQLYDREREREIVKDSNSGTRKTKKNP